MKLKQRWQRLKYWQKGGIMGMMVILVVLTGCQSQDTAFIPSQVDNDDIDVSLIENQECNDNSDCVVTNVGVDDCCASCAFESISTKANQERELWIEINCGEWSTVSLMSFENAPERYKSCFEYDECVSKDTIIAYCENNICKLKDKRNKVDEELSDDEICIEEGGTWTYFGDTCGDSCTRARATEPVICGQAFTWGCNCGPEMCWNGESCELIDAPTITECPNDVNFNCMPSIQPEWQIYCTKANSKWIGENCNISITY